MARRVCLKRERVHVKVHWVEDDGIGGPRQACTDAGFEGRTDVGVLRGASLDLLEIQSFVRITFTASSTVAQCNEGIFCTALTEKKQLLQE